jgi:hypothetical protein
MPFGPLDLPMTGRLSMIPLHKYRKYQKPKSEERSDQVAALAERLGLPRAALDGDTALAIAVVRPAETGRQPRCASPIQTRSRSSPIPM